MGIKDSNDVTVMDGSGWPANSQNSFWKCLSSGDYTFTITDDYGDGLCCTYGNGGYSVKVNDVEVASGGDFDSKETKTFEVVSNTDSPVAPPTTSPTHSVPTMYPTNSLPTDPLPTPYPTDVPPTPFPTAQTCTPKGEYCNKHKIVA